MPPAGAAAQLLVAAVLALLGQPHMPLMLPSAAVGRGGTADFGGGTTRGPPPIRHLHDDASATTSATTSASAPYAGGGGGDGGDGGAPGPTWRAQKTRRAWEGRPRIGGPARCVPVHSGQAGQDTLNSDAPNVGERVLL